MSTGWQRLDMTITNSPVHMCNMHLQIPCRWRSLCSRLTLYPSWPFTCEEAGDLPRTSAAIGMGLCRGHLSVMVDNAVEFTCLFLGAIPELILGCQ